MNKLLSICERFAVEYDVLFNSKKSKLIAYNTLKQDTSGNSIELSFMNDKILQSNFEKNLGNIIGVGCNQEMIDDAVSAFYAWIDMVMSHFSHVPSHVRYKLFKTYVTLWLSAMGFSEQGDPYILCCVVQVGVSNYWRPIYNSI